MTRRKGGVGSTSTINGRKPRLRPQTPVENSGCGQEMATRKGRSNGKRTSKALGNLLVRPSSRRGRSWGICGGGAISTRSGLTHRGGGDGLGRRGPKCKTKGHRVLFRRLKSAKAAVDRREELWENRAYIPEAGKGCSVLGSSRFFVKSVTL